MRKIILSATLAIAILSCNGQENISGKFEAGNINVSIEQGNEWFHDFSIMGFIKKKNAPQIAIWAEDMEGNYLSTLYVSEKIAKQSWIAAGGNRRKEALPYWSHAQGKPYADGLYLPTKEEPLPDAVTGATPKKSFSIRGQIPQNTKQCIINCEFNHSTDFNKYFPKEAEEGEKNYSGGNMGSGQPAIVYQVIIDFDANEKELKGKLIGHSSPDGSDGNLYSDLSELTTALQIVKEITVSVGPSASSKLYLGLTE